MNRRKKETEDATRPYERCFRCGPEALADEELLAVIFRTGTNGRDAISVAREVFAKAGEETGLPGINRLTVQELMQIPGIGRVKAVQVQAVCEISRRIAAKERKTGPILPSPAAIAEIYMERLRHMDYEVLMLLLLDSRMRLIREDIMGRGNVSSAPFSVRELYAHALRHEAVSIILLHNHPGGDPTPSGEDLAVTREAYEAGKIIGIRLTDHIIIGDRSYVSFRETGFFDELER